MVSLAAGFIRLLAQPVVNRTADVSSRVINFFIKPLLVFFVIVYIRTRESAGSIQNGWRACTVPRHGMGPYRFRREVNNPIAKLRHFVH
jgi:hypothetical protein